MGEYLWIALGGALGSVARFWLSGAVAQRWGAEFPYGTLAVNIVGCFFIGLFYTLSGDVRALSHPTVKQFFMVGICGGFTTFSAFSIQTLHLAVKGDWVSAGANVIGSVLLCLVAVWGGHTLGLAVHR